MVSAKRLIVNADDCNLTAGVTRGILRAHDAGILSSTTILMNLPLSERTLQELKRRKKLGLGIHLNVTFGAPVSRAEKVRSLLKFATRFRRPADYLSKLPRRDEVVREYTAQIRLFEQRFGRAPDHLDTHHHLHDHPLFFEALSNVARRWKVPVRRSHIFQLADGYSKTRGLYTTDYLFGNLEAKFHWQREPLLGLIENLPEGTSEIGCHPGYCDAELCQVSSLQETREKELQLFSDKRIRNLLSEHGIELIRFSEV